MILIHIKAEIHWTKGCLVKYIYLNKEHSAYIAWDKSTLTVVHMENNTIIKIIQE